MREIFSLAAIAACGAFSVGCVFVPGIPVTRADLADSYIAFERVLREHPPAESRVGEVNRAFDAATLAFFSGAFERVIEAVDRLRDSLIAGPASPRDRMLLASLKIDMEPPVLVLGGKVAPVATTASMYRVEAAASVSLKLRLSAAGQEPFEIPVMLERDALGGYFVETRLPADRLHAGRYELALSVGQADYVVRRRWTVAARSLDALRGELMGRLDALADSEPLRRAREVFRDRAALLTDLPSEVDSAQFLTDPLLLTVDLRTELDAIETGRNPYAGRSGETYRPLRRNGGTIPLWVFAPPAPASAAASSPASTAARPLVIVFHGAGGDERMFLDGYGGGRIRDLAIQHDFVVASPLTNPFLRDPGAADALIDDLSADYRIDSARVYVLGHSLGAGAAGLIAARSARAAAACTIAGGMFGDAARVCPTLVCLAKLDAVNPIARSRPAADAALARGLPLEIRVIENYGHTLVVGHVLPDAIAWLLARRLEAP
jgi:predicted esterase